MSRGEVHVDDVDAGGEGGAGPVAAQCPDLEFARGEELLDDDGAQAARCSGYGNSFYGRHG